VVGIGAGGLRGMGRGRGGKEFSCEDGWGKGGVVVYRYVVRLFVV